MTSQAIPTVFGHEDLLHVERETHRFLRVAAESPLAAHIPTYPAFTVETLTGHVGAALRVFETILSGGTYSDRDPIPRPEGAAVIEWAASGLQPVLQTLRDVSPDQKVVFPHGVGEQPASTIAAALAVEVGIHRWDLESVLGDHAPLPADLAVGAIDKVFESYAPRLAGSGVAPIGGTVEFRSTDSDVGWSVSVDNGALAASRLDGQDVQPDTTVNATAEDLALLIWKRWPPPRSGVEVSGSIDVLKRFLTIDYIPDPRTTPAH